MKLLTKYILSVIYSTVVPLATIYVWFYVLKIDYNNEIANLEAIEIVGFSIITLSILVSCLVMFTLLNVKIIPAISITMRPNLLIGIEIVDIERAIYLHILCIRIKIKPLKLP
tara:strand:+ start:409 stop:747 length:339 start_codon:yes stop_codon:yes gene_type:complete